MNNYSHAIGGSAKLSYNQVFLLALIKGHKKQQQSSKVKLLKDKEIVILLLLLQLQMIDPFLANLITQKDLYPISRMTT